MGRAGDRPPGHARGNGGEWALDQRVQVQRAPPTTLAVFQRHARKIWNVRTPAQLSLGTHFHRCSSDGLLCDDIWPSASRLTLALGNVRTRGALDWHDGSGTGGSGDALLYRRTRRCCHRHRMWCAHSMDASQRHLDTADIVGSDRPIGKPAADCHPRMATLGGDQPSRAG